MAFKKMKYILFEISSVNITCTTHVKLRVCVLRRFSHVQLFVNPWMVCSLLGSSVHGIL